MENLKNNITNNKFIIKIALVFIMIFIVTNVVLCVQDKNNEDVEQNEKYEMVIEEDETKEFISIKFIKKDENIESEISYDRYDNNYYRKFFVLEVLRIIWYNT